MLAHLGPPDMRVAISYALHGATSVDLLAGPSPVVPLDLVALGKLTFEAVDLDAFPCLGLARAAARTGGTAPCVLNAANEVAVHAFLGERLPFSGIPAVIEQTLERLPSTPIRALRTLAAAGPTARRAHYSGRGGQGTGLRDGWRLSWCHRGAGWRALWASRSPAGGGAQAR